MSSSSGTPTDLARQRPPDLPLAGVRTRLFCAASLNEWEVAEVVRRQLPPGEDVLVFDLNISGEAEAARSEIRGLCDAAGWKRVRFIEEGPGPSDFLATSKTLAAGRWLRRLLWFRRRVGAALAAEGLRTGNSAGKDVAVHFNILHEYVIGALGLLPKAVRLHYPHGFNQPRVQSIRDYPYYYSPRGTVSGRQRLVWRWTGRCLTPLYRLFGKGIVPLPFDGVDFCWTMSATEPRAPFRRIEGDMIGQVLRAVSAAPALARRIDEAFGADESAADAVVMLSEPNVSADNQRLGEAYRALLTRVRARHPEALRTWIKPHPRTGGARYRELLATIRLAAPEFDTRAWPESVAKLPIEIVCVRRQFAVASSLASTALPPGISASIPVYVSSGASKIFDSGWTARVNLSYEAIAKTLHAEGLAEDLDDPGSLRTR